MLSVMSLIIGFIICILGVFFMGYRVGLKRGYNKAHCDIVMNQLKISS